MWRSIGERGSSSACKHRQCSRPPGGTAVGRSRRQPDRNRRQSRVDDGASTRGGSRTTRRIRLHSDWKWTYGKQCRRGSNSGGGESRCMSGARRQLSRNAHHRETAGRRRASCSQHDSPAVGHGTTDFNGRQCLGRVAGDDSTAEKYAITSGQRRGGTNGADRSPAGTSRPFSTEGRKSKGGRASIGERKTEDTDATR